MNEVEVIHAVPDLRRSAGGIATTVPALAAALEAHGIRSRFLTLAQDVDFEWFDQTFEVQRTGRLSYLPEVLTMCRDAISGGATRVVLHSHGLWHPLNHALARAAVRVGVPLVISVHGILLPWARANKKLRKDIAWHLYQRADLTRAGAVHVTSELERDIVARSVCPHDLEVIPFGVHLPAVLPNREIQSGRVLLFLGRLHPVKNLLGLIRAFAKADPKGWILRIVGPEEEGHLGELKSLVGLLGVTHKVDFVGPAYGLAKEQLLAQADVLALPSFSENFGSVVVEALAMGRPVVTSWGTPWRVLASEGCGWWVSPDVESLAIAIQEIAGTSPDTLVVMGARGRKLVEARYSWASAAGQMGDLYRRLTYS